MKPILAIFILPVSSPAASSLDEDWHIKVYALIPKGQIMQSSGKGLEIPVNSDGLP
jgi:hypothetical protein